MHCEANQGNRRWRKARGSQSNTEIGKRLSFGFGRLRSLCRRKWIPGRRSFFLLAELFTIETTLLPDVALFLLARGNPRREFGYTCGPTGRSRAIDEDPQPGEIGVLRVLVDGHLDLNNATDELFEARDVLNVEPVVVNRHAEALAQLTMFVGLSASFGNS